VSTRRTHCQRGHEFSDENTYVDPAGHRNCRMCGNARKRRLETVEVACPDCGTVGRVSRAWRPDRVFPMGTCRSCAMRRVRDEDLVVDAAEYVQWWRDAGFTPRDAREIWAGLSLLVPSTYDDDALREAA
jgi:hypothetical protein